MNLHTIKLILLGIMVIVNGDIVICNIQLIEDAITGRLSLRRFAKDHHSEMTDIRRIVAVAKASKVIPSFLAVTTSR